MNGYERFSARPPLASTLALQQVAIVCSTRALTDATLAEVITENRRWRGI